MIVVIPAYEPDGRLVALVRELRERAPGDPVLVVDDGSGPAYRDLFDTARSAGAEVIGYAGNRGKGHALKAAFAHIARHHPGEDVVTADSDGQHRVDDILRVAGRLARGDADLVLGARLFVGDVPPRSRVGNAVSRRVFALAAGRSLLDTQTGLRGLPARLLPELGRIRGERFDYEQRMLLELCARNAVIAEVEIATVYLEQNASSHFRPVRDSLSVVAPIARFGAVSFGSFLLDLAAVQLLALLTGSLALAVVGARLLSGAANFALNRRVVFRADTSLRRALARYLLLAGVLLVAGYGAIAGFVALGMPLLLAKVVTDVALYVGSFVAQRRFVFLRAPAPVDRPENSPERQREHIGAA